MNERNVDLVKAYELINGGKLNKNGKSAINWFALKEEFINEECFKTNEGMFTTSGDLAEEFIDEFAGSKVKALATLNSLEKKKLIYSKPRNFEGKGLVSIFYPNKK